jgi:hypothetical protein
VRRTLVTALLSCAERSVKPEARNFLLGLSRDELEFIAGYFGSCILESSGACNASRPQVADLLAELQPRHNCSQLRMADREHKMILLLEYLGRCSAGMLAARP